MDMGQEILRLTSFWHQYVCLDHHKDRDCHWIIEKKWSYGDKPKYSFHHYGYVAEEESGEERETYEEALIDMRDFLIDSIKYHKEWALNVLDKPAEWDVAQRKKAKMITEFKI